jgi:hypothetical protein
VQRSTFNAIALFAASTMAFAAFGRAAPARAEEPKKLVPTISEIMIEAHGCRTAYIKQVRTELAKDEPDWLVVESKSRELVRVGKLLALNAPPKGTRAEWEQITNLYVARATVLTDSAERKDKEEAGLTARRIGMMCSTCHRAHRN